VAGVDFDTQRLSGVPLRLQTSTKHQVAVLRKPERLKSVVLGQGGERRTHVAAHLSIGAIDARGRGGGPSGWAMSP